MCWSQTTLLWISSPLVCPTTESVIWKLFDWDGFVIKPVVDQIELHLASKIGIERVFGRARYLGRAYSPLTQGVKLDDPELLEWEKKYKLPKGNILLTWSYLQDSL